MERPKTTAEVRKEKFLRQSKIAKDLADLAMAEVDEALSAPILSAEHLAKMDGLHNYEYVLWQRVLAGEITHAESEEALTAYISWVETGESGLTADNVIMLPMYDPNQLPLLPPDAA